MPRPLSNYSPLAFVNREKDLHSQKWYAYGNRYAIAAPEYKLPPFQIIADDATNGDPSTFTVTLVNNNTGTETNITTQIVTSGLEVIDKTTYRVIRFSANAPLPALSEKGSFRLVIETNVETWYSEDFSVCNVDDLIQIEWGHGENISIADGEILFTQGWQGRLYFNETIGLPEYPFEEVLSNRDGKEYVKKIVSYKMHKFQIVVPEHVIDVLRFVRMADFVTIRYKGLEYPVDMFRFDDPEWQKNGDVAGVVCMFTYDTVALTIGKSSDSSVLVVDCYTVQYNALAVIVENDSEYNAEGYTNAGGQFVSFKDGDYVIIKNASVNVWLLYEYTGGTYVLVSVSGGEVVEAAREGTYWTNNGIATGIVTNDVDTINVNTVTGYVLPDSIVSLYLVLNNGTEVLADVESASDFNSDGITFDFECIDGIVGVRAEVSTPLCETVYTSSEIEVGPLDLIVIGGAYSDPVAAFAGGLESGDYFSLTAGNPYGMPEGMVVRLDPCNTYVSDEAAENAIGNDVTYCLAVPNVYGIPVGLVKVSLDALTVYDDDEDAVTNGFSLDDLYLLDGGLLGVGTSGFVKRVVEDSF
jgi:hypothetical protein